jgi:DNA-binding NarL/FixJ family response regulator
LISKPEYWHQQNIHGGGSAQRLDKGNQRAKQVLIVHDYDLFRQALALLLEWNAGFKNVQAGSLIEARRIFDLDSEIDLAIVSLDLPDGDGVDLITQLRRADPRIPVLALTRRLGSGVRVRALKAGADKVLTTTASGEEISDAIMQLVGASAPLPLPRVGRSTSR